MGLVPPHRLKNLSRSSQDAEGSRPGGAPGRAAGNGYEIGCEISTTAGRLRHPRAGPAALQGQIS